MRRLAMLVLTSALVACRFGRTESAALERVLPLAIARGPGTIIDMATIVEQPWREVAVFGPYTAAATVAQCLGVREGWVLSRGIEDRDDATLLVFTYDDGATASVVLQRRVADFGPEAVGAVYARNVARFRVRLPGKSTWGNLVPAGRITRRCT